MPPYAGPPLEIASERPLASEDEHLARLDRLMAGRPDDGEVWLFAYGSLIWRPDFAHEAETLAVAHGWHRAFCLGWMRAFRGCPERPGLMMGLDRGGACRGVGFRLPRGREAENLLQVLRRELPFRVSGQSARWLRVQTPEGPRRMLGFAVDRDSEAYVAGLDEPTLVGMLATSAGPMGTMAEYLANTVAHLEARGIRDRHLWRLQALVAARLEALA